MDTLQVCLLVAAVSREARRKADKAGQRSSEYEQDGDRCRRRAYSRADNGNGSGLTKKRNLTASLELRTFSDNV